MCLINKNSVNEGVEFLPGKKVRYVSWHEENVETSEITNPTLDDFDYDVDIEIWSIFRRKKSNNRYSNYIGAYNKSDGNPLIYALKGIDGWSFETKQDKTQIIKQMNLICYKYAKSHYHDCTILVPSKSSLNLLLANKVKEYSDNNCDIIPLVLLKLNTDDIYNIALEPNSSFYNTFRNFRKPIDNDEDYQDALQRLENVLDKMDEEADEYPTTYRTHLNTDSDIRNAIKELFKINPDYKDECNLINDKDVLIIDDTISRGASITHAVKLIREYFTPKSISVLTLFSRKYNK